MDGNSSWAHKNGVPQMEGYLAGMRNLSKIAVLCHGFGVEYTTFYAFSSENWERPKTWISSFMDVALSFLKHDESTKDLDAIKAKLNLLGDVSRLDKNVRDTLEDLVKKTEHNCGLNVNLAVSYGGRNEIVRACQKVVSKKLEITEKNIQNNLDTDGVPDPDIVVRTGSQKRLSNFLLWQISYSELYFSDVCWPEFGENELKMVISDFCGRKRNYGR